MKIDEKVLTYFESCNSPVDKEGYLYKKVRRPGSGLQGTWLMYCFEKQTERVVRLSKVNKLRGDFFKTVFKFSFQNLCDISPPTGLPVSSNQLCKKLSTQGVCTAVSKTQLSHTHTHRVRSRLPIRSAGSCWRGTSSSTKTGRPTGIWSEWLFWRAAPSSCASPRRTSPSRWCGASRGCGRTSLPRRTRPVRRAGSKPCCQPATATWPCL